ncbi:hypothetical protein SAMN04488490_1190 [Marinobacter sp. LV10R510-11A]|uniref:hypothetical protein n=1 Tax=Marinobacter sp. LV10R510-11A TaxID=1415568 RepID=UPI000BB898A3|nr:hypothetical protein [Marinobacter sp. LV10R510-11A]SOB75579.1 hypothetical protein SAMN04488490_1190 [Marinobacter sp. LV10R510-11A]
MEQFSIVKNCWVAWQMIPGYACERSVPYCSPIFVTGVTPLKTGKGHIKLEFLNALYAQGVQDFYLNIKVLKRAKDYLVGEIIYSPGEDSGRVAVISHIEFQWLERFCPELWFHRPPSTTSHGTNSISVYLNEVFFREQP